MLVTGVEWCNSCMQSLFSGWGQPVRYAGSYTIVSMHLEIGLLSVIQNSRVSTIQGVQCIEVYGRTCPI